MMKKIFWMAACALLLAGCGGDSAETTATSSPSSVQTAEGSDNAPAGEITQSAGQQVDQINSVSATGTAKESSENAP